MKSRVLKTLLVLFVIPIVGIVGVLACVYLGVYNIAAVKQHTRPVYWLLEQTMKYSVRRRAAGIQPPPLTDSAMREKGLYHYRRHCERCHGGPGVPPEDFAKGMTPVPLNLVQVSRLWTSSELYWSTKYGLKATGMPAFEYRLAEGELWELVAFLRELSTLSPQDYKLRSEARAPPETSASAQTLSRLER